jgi:hypothetical protein
MLVFIVKKFVTMHDNMNVKFFEQRLFLSVYDHSIGPCLFLLVYYTPGVYSSRPRTVTVSH